MQIKTKRISVGAMILLALLFAMSGCDAWRWAPSEAQKQNAYLHQRTSAAVAAQTTQEHTSELLQLLAQRTAEQSEAMLAYFGFPQRPPPARRLADLLADEQTQLTRQAHREALQRPNPVDLTANLVEIAVALGGITGGVFGTRLVRSWRQAQQRGQALREVIQGNQAYKQQHPQQTELFKSAHQQQSPTTRRLVTELKPNSNTT